MLLLTFFRCCFIRVRDSFVFGFYFVLIAVVVIVLIAVVVIVLIAVIVIVVVAVDDFPVPF